MCELELGSASDWNRGPGTVEGPEDVCVNRPRSKFRTRFYGYVDHVKAIGSPTAVNDEVVRSRDLLAGVSTHDKRKELVFRNSGKVLTKVITKVFDGRKVTLLQQ